jgi:hypothetical protein
MKDNPTPRKPSHDNSADPVPSTDPSASDIPASTAKSMTLKQWEDSQSHYPIQRVPRMVVAHIFKGSIFGPRSWIIEPARKSARINWVRVFQEAKAARDAAAADSEGS